MLKRIFQVLIVILLILIKTALSPLLANFSFYPDLVFIFVFSWIISKPLKQELELTFLAGILLDFFSGRTLGFYALAFLLSVFLSFNLYRSFFHLHKITLPLVIFFAPLFYNALLIGMNFFIQPQEIVLSLGLWQKTVKVILSDFVLMILIYPIVSKVKKRLSFKDQLKLA